MNRVIVLAGPKGSGKSTVADWLVRERGYKSLSLADKLKSFAKALFPRTLTMEDLYGPSLSRERLFSPAEKRRAMVELQTAATWLRLDPEGKTALAALLGDHDPEKRAIPLLNRTFAQTEDAVRSPRTVLQRLGTEWGRAIWDEVWLDAVRRTIEVDPSGKYAIPDCRFPNEVQYLRTKLDADVYWLEAGERIASRQGDTHASEPKRADLLPLCTGEVLNKASLDMLYECLPAIYPG